DLHYFLFLDGEYTVDLGDSRVGGVLHLLAKLAALVLADIPVLLELLEKIHAVPPDVAHGDPRLLGIVMRNLGQFAAALLVQLGKRHTDDLPLGGRVEAEAAVADRLVHGGGESAVPDLDVE